MINNTKTNKNTPPSLHRVALWVLLGVIAVSTLIVLVAGFDLLPLWMFLGVPLIGLILFYPIVAVLELMGFEDAIPGWLLQDIALLLWLLGFVLIVGFEAGLSVSYSTLYALLLLAFAGMYAHYLLNRLNNNSLTTKELKLGIIAPCILAVWGITLYGRPSERFIVFDWPCREASWNYDDAKDEGERKRNSINQFDKMSTAQSELLECYAKYGRVRRGKR